MALTTDQMDLLRRAELLAAADAPDQAAQLLRALLDSAGDHDREVRGRLSITLAHFLRQSGDDERAVESYLAAESLLEGIAGDAILERAHACFGAALLLVEDDHPEASRTTARALELYRRYPFTRPADVADAAALHLQAQVFIERTASEADFREAWQLIRAAPPNEMTESLLDQWLLLIRPFAEALGSEEGSELLGQVSRWHPAGDHAERGEPRAQSFDGARSLSQSELLEEIRTGHEALLRGQATGVVLPRIEIEAIEMILTLHDPGRHPPHLLAGALFSLGRCFTELEDEVRAEYYYRQSIETDPSHANARYNLGNVLMRRGEYGAAEEQFRAVVAQDPDNSYALRNLTYVLAQGGQIESAVEIAAATALAANDPEAPVTRLLEICHHYDGWGVARSVVDAVLTTVDAPQERMVHVRELLAPLLHRSS